MRAAWGLFVVATMLLSGCQGAHDAVRASHAAGAPRTVDLAEGGEGEGAGEIIGRVLDEEVLPLGGVTVRFVGSQVSVQTTDDGVFYFTNVPARTHSLNFSKPGYESATKTASVGVGHRETVNAVLRQVADVSAFVDEGFIFNGHINCSVRANASGTNSNPECGPGIVKEDQDVSRLKWMDLLPGLRWVQLEVDWQPTVPAVNERLRLAIRPDGFTSYRQVEGTHPLRVLLGPEDWPAILKAQEKDYVRRGGQVQLLVIPGEITNQAGAGAGTAIYQDFTIYGTAWYRMDPPEGYSRLPKA